MTRRATTPPAADPRHAARRASLLLLGLWLAATALTAQMAVRPDDPLGLSIREPRVRVVHSRTPEVPGTSMHLQMWDPWMAYQRGRSYFFREWGPRDHAFRHLPDRPEAQAANSCGVCHNTPYPSVGAGGVVAVPVRAGRNAVHFFGGGLLETLGMQIRAQLLAAHDDNGNGYLDVPAETAGRRAVVAATPDRRVDFGSLADEDGNGRPDLDPAIMVRVVDADGNRLLFDDEGRPATLKSPGVVGYDLAVGVFASSAGDHQFPTMRLFSSGVFVTVMGLLPEGDAIPVRMADGATRYMLDDWGRISNAGGFLSELVLTGDPFGEPDPAERATVTEGELDLLDWFMLNHPTPTVAPQTDQTRRGRELMDSLGCTGCHIPDWEILPADDGTGMPGDRRFFHLEVAHDPVDDRLEGRLEMLTREVEGPDGSRLLVPRRDGFTVRNLFTDLRHHDLGRRFWDYSYHDGRVGITRRFRTTPLWGTGSIVRHGHDGMSLSLDHVIRRHGGDAEEARAAWVAASAEDREAVLAFLRTLVLYAPERVPTDLDGDGVIADRFRRDGRELGPELFRPELLFRVAPRYRGRTTGPDGEEYFSWAMLNVAEAYGQDLEALRDSDGDMVPDVSERETPETETETAGPAAAGPAARGPVSGRRRGPRRRWARGSEQPTVGRRKPPSASPAVRVRRGAGPARPRGT